MLKYFCYENARITAKPSGIDAGERGIAFDLLLE